MVKAGLGCGPSSTEYKFLLGGTIHSPASEAREGQGYSALGLAGLALASGQMPLLGPKEPPEGLEYPLWAGVLGSGWPATGFNNSNSECKRFHPSCLWAEEERKEEGEEGEEGAG